MLLQYLPYYNAFATQDLAWRVSVFLKWLDKGAPHSFPLPAFYYPQGFLTAVLQRHARTQKVSACCIHYYTIHH
jgi:hypothetical protein